MNETQLASIGNATNKSTAPERTNSVRDGILCACVTAIAIAVTHPVAEMGFIDDWSYIRTALVFAQTGHIVYNGWATAILGWIIPWGALFIKLFGFSFTTVRLSTFPLAMASVYLFHASMVRFGITARNAAVGALGLGLSPLFIPLAASYMTDIAGLLSVLLCLYLCQRALAAESTRAVILWLIAATLTNLVSGTVRQIAWLGALVMVPLAAWLLRRRSGVIAATSALWVFSVVFAWLSIRWFEGQPYALPETILQGPVTPHMVGHMLVEVLKSVLFLALVTLPISIAWLTNMRRLGTRAYARIASILLVLASISIALGQRGELDHRVMPWLGHIVGTQSIFSSTGEMLGTRPVTLTLPIRSIISLLVIAALLTLIESLSKKPSQSALSDTASLREALWLLGPFAVSYLAFLLPRALYTFVYDRYLLTLMPVAIILLVLIYQRTVARQLPLLAIATLTLFALYAIAGTHDWFALNRARVAAVSMIRNSGIPATSIQGGFDYDGWTQIEAAGYINEPRVRNPANAYHPNLNVAKTAKDCRLNFAEYTPAIHPKYFVVFERMDCLVQSPYPFVTYSTWLPPFRRQIYIQQDPSSAN